MIKIPELFGSLVFNDEVMKQRLPQNIYKSLHKTIEDGRDLDTTVAEAVANAMKEWAIEKGATHFTHWFQPMTGVTAEKHDSFITPKGMDGIIMEFSGKELIKGEPDASSFPSGGLRATFEARGYTAWDPTSYAFIKDNSLCIPTVFCSYSGEALDKKTPLLKSIELVGKQALRIVHLFGHTDVTRVTASVGPEQEYFLIDKKDFAARKDLRFTGRTLFGAKPPKGQELDDHYFGAIRPRVKVYMQELDEELWKLGILAKTEHNEGAPAQHELAPIFTNTNTATDHNQLTMETMKKVAHKHGFVCLLHEKPFEGINGSGKHNNWSLNTNTGINVFKPGKNPAENKMFLLFLCAVIKAVDLHQDLLRISVTSAGNDHRLGAHEAPPAIVSVFLGDELTDILESIKNGSEYRSHTAEMMATGVHVLPDFMKDTTDRNRTSPLAFTGNKFEFRMLGSSSSIAGPNITINTIVADVLNEFADKLEAAENFDSAVTELLRETLLAHDRIIFNGNNYADEWIEEAERRGLLNLRTTVDALPHYLHKKNIDLYTKNGVFTKDEINSRFEIQLENYSKVLNIEALTMLEMSKRDIIPAVSAFIKQLTDGIMNKKNIGISLENDAEMKLAERCSKLLNILYDNTEILERYATES
ncbi:MAG: glutamine synthetase III, partial [Christensenellaceae bacterium]|nr:glutamine synthetase III [Christensenellaceae bacterium]